MSGSTSRRRGHDWEREVACTLSDFDHIEAERIPGATEGDDDFSDFSDGALMGDDDLPF